MMKRLVASTLVLSLIAATGTTFAQSTSAPSVAPAAADPLPQIDGHTSFYDDAKVIRVDPVLVSRNDDSMDACSEDDRGYAQNERDPYDNRRYDDRYDDRRYDDRYDDRRYDDRQDGRYEDRRYGTETGRTMATMIGGVVGAVLGSKMGGGSARYVTSSVGSMMGSMAGRQVYENVQRSKQPPRRTEVTICGPVREGEQQARSTTVTAYDVTYEYGGRQHVTRTHYHPGERIRVRVDVRAE